MKTYQQSRRPKGFTLVELLVVITIIAVLAALSFAGVNMAIKKARKTEGLVAATSLAQAVENFYGEYNRLPDVGGSGTIKTDGSGQKLLEVLLGQEASGKNMENPRSIVFLTANEAKGGKGGLDYSGNSTVAQGLYDPFGEPFTVVLNTDYKDVLNFSFGGKQYNLRNRQVAVYSAGGDKVEGTNDDITSWSK